MRMTNYLGCGRSAASSTINLQCRQKVPFGRMNAVNASNIHLCRAVAHRHKARDYHNHETKQYVLGWLSSKWSSTHTLVTHCGHSTMSTVFHTTSTVWYYNCNHKFRNAQQCPLTLFSQQRPNEPCTPYVCIYYIVYSVHIKARWMSEHLSLPIGSFGWNSTSFTLPKWPGSLYSKRWVTESHTYTNLWHVSSCEEQCYKAAAE